MKKMHFLNNFQGNCKATFPPPAPTRHPHLHPPKKKEKKKRAKPHFYNFWGEKYVSGFSKVRMVLSFAFIITRELKSETLCDEFIAVELSLLFYMYAYLNIYYKY